MRWLLLPLLAALLAGCGTPAAKKGTEPPAQTGEQGGAKTGEAPAPSSDPQAEKKGPVLKQLYTDEKTGLSVRTPILWEAGEKEGTVVVLISPQNGVEDLFRENIVITADDQFKDLTLAAYLKALGEEIRKRYPDTQTLESGEVEIDGILSHWMVDAYTGPKGPARVYRVVVIREQVAYVFHATAPEQTFELYRPTFEAIARSIAWPKPEAEKKP
ncbi:MAG: hypothetical protein ACOY93_00900 [Bacillota bacterium]